MLLQDKVFTFAQNSAAQESEKEIILQIFEENSCKIPNKISVIKNAENYDSYRADCGQESFFVRLSLDSSNTFSDWGDFLFSPKVIFKGSTSFGQEVFYVVEEFCDEIAVADIGESILARNLPKFIDQLKKIHASNKPSPNLQSFIKTRFQNSSIDKNPEYEELIKANSSNFQLLKEELDDAKRQVSQQYKSIFDGQALIHGGISPTNILLGKRGFIFTSWENSTKANPLFDVAEIDFNFQLPQETEFLLFEELKPTNFSWSDYFVLKSYWSNIRLIDLTSSYIKEVFLYDSRRQDEILKIIKLFYQNIQKFENLESFKKNRSRLLEFFGQSV